MYLCISLILNSFFYFFYFCFSSALLRVRATVKLKKISPGAYIFQRPFLRGVFLEGLIYGGKFTFQNLIGLALQFVVNLSFLLCFTLYMRAIFQVQALGGQGGLYLEGLFFRNLRYVCKENLSMKQKIFSPFLIMLPLKNPLRNLDGFCLLVCLFLFAIYTL